MKRATSILIGILLGALAAGLGAGIFFKKANDDRRRLGEQLNTLTRTTTELRDQSQAAIEDANKKVQAANAEVLKAQAIMKGLEEDQALSAKAVPLLSPALSRTRGWTDVIGFGLGASFKIPSGTSVIKNDDTSIQAVAAQDGSSAWFTLAPYTLVLEQGLLQSVASSEPVTYTLNGRLFTGIQGIDRATGLPTMVLRIRSKGRAEFVLSIREPWRTTPRQSSMMTVLQTFQFSS